MKISRAVVASLLIASLLALNLPFTSMGDTPMGLPPVQGHWWVDNSTKINDTIIEVNGNLTINNTGTLELINVTLVMNGNITVFGSFIIRNVTIIMNMTILRPEDPFGIYIESGGANVYT